MAKPGFSEPRFLSAALLGLIALVLGTGGFAAEQKQEFDSKLPFRVWVSEREGERPKFAGCTPSDKPLVIPPCRWWAVEPLGKDVAAALKEIKDKKIPGLRLTKPTDDDLARVCELPHLRTLEFWLCWQVTDAGMAHLKELKGLQSLNLWCCELVTDAGLAHLKELKALQSLDLAYCKQVTDAGLAHLKELKALRSLILQSCDQVTDAGLTHLKELKALQSLNLSYCDQVTPVAVDTLRKSLPHAEIVR